MTFQVYRSNRMERLADALAEVLEARPLSPFEPETVVVQSRGMQRWLSLQCALRMGVWGNVKFPFPRAFVWSLGEALQGKGLLTLPPEALAPLGPDSDPMSPFRLSFAVAKLLPSLAQASPELSHYLSPGDEDVRRLSLALRLAETFDQYAVYRPELLRDFEKGLSDDLQSRLWRALCEEQPSLGGGAPLEKLLSALKTSSGLEGVLPRRVMVFGISMLPPLYLDLLQAVSRHVPVYLFVLAPSREYLGVAAQATGENALLVSLGRQAREFQELLESRTHYQEDERDWFLQPEPVSALSVLQRDMLALVERGPKAQPKQLLSPGDSSISVHACHGPTREVEVLRDQLLALFEADPSLEPHDVIVMMPKVDEYSPTVDAVFDLDPKATGYLPYHIADRSMAAVNMAVEAMMMLLRALRGRLKASEVLDVLGLPLVMQRFGLTSSDLERVSAWVRKAGVRWGIDAPHRASFEQPEVLQNTWRFGLERLFLGYVLPASSDGFEGVLPEPVNDSSDGALLGNLADFCSKLFARHKEFATSAPINEWETRLLGLLTDLFGQGATEAPEVMVLREAIARMAVCSRLAGFEEPISLPAVQSALETALVEEKTHHNFLSGGITFCALLPMRSIPFKVVCLLGMNDADFPRKSTRPAFDRLAQERRLGDRSVADEDRYLFLEAITAARKSLVITYTGRDPQNNTEKPPSVVVTDLLTAVDKTFFIEPSAGGESPSPSSRVLVHHRLQAFSPAYFETGRDLRLFSFGSVEGRGARALVASSFEQPRFQLEPLPPLPEKIVTLDQLLRFFENPSRGFLQRLGVKLFDDDEVVLDREVVEANALDMYEVGANLLESLLGGRSKEEAVRRAREQGLFPLGSPGLVLERRLLEAACALKEHAEPWLTGQRKERFPFALELGEFRIEGSLSDLWDEAQVRCQYSRLKPKHEVSLWVNHLALCAQDAPELPRRSVLIGKPPEGRPEPKEGGPRAQSIELGPVSPAAAKEHLSDLLMLYELGQRVPLPFFPQAASDFIEALKKKQLEEALEDARNGFEPSGRKQGPPSESEELHIACCFRGVDPISREPREVGDILVPSFSELAQRILEPLWEARVSK